MSEPFRALLRSRKFLLLTLDAVITLVIYFTAKYAPHVIDDARFLIAVLQPVFLFVIGAYAYEDAQIKAQIAAVNRTFELQNAAAYQTRAQL